MRNNFGKLLREIRENIGIRLYDMAKNLDISSSFLSAIETSKKPVPLDLVEKIIQIYDINIETALDLRNYAKETITNISFKIKKPSSSKFDFAETLALNFNSLGEEDMKKILEIVNKKGHNDYTK